MNGTIDVWGHAMACPAMAGYVRQAGTSQHFFQARVFWTFNKGGV